MSKNLTHNENIKNIDDVLLHLELTIECLKIAKSKHLNYIAESSSSKTSVPKYKKSKMEIATG